MQSKHIKILFFLICFSILTCSLWAQTDSDPKAYRSEKAVILYTGGGISYFIGKVGTPAGFDAQVKKTNPIGSLRLM